MEKVLNNILNLMKEIEYGYAVNGKDIYPYDEWDNSFSKIYKLQSPEELIENKKGVCWDQVELERYYLEKENIESKSFFIVEYDGKEYPTHTFIIVYDEKYFYWLEHSWEPYKGIRKYETMEIALKDVKDKFINMLKNRNISIDEIVIYEYKKPKYGIDSKEFFYHCENSIKENK